MSSYHTVPMFARVLGVLLAPAIAAVVLFMTLTVESKPVWQAIPALVLATVVGYVVNRLPHTIVLHEADACVEFRSILRTRLVPVASIRAIGRSRTMRGGLDVTHARGSELLLPGFRGFDDVVAWIRSRNPAVAVDSVLDR